MSKKNPINDSDTMPNSMDMFSFDGGQLYDDGKSDYSRYYKGKGRSMALIPLEDEIMFPHLTLNTVITNPDSVTAVTEAIRSNKPVFLFLPVEDMPQETELVKENDVLYSRGVVAKIIECESNPNGSLFLTVKTGTIGAVVALESTKPYLLGDVAYLVPNKIKKDELEEHTERLLKEAFNKVADTLSEQDRKRLDELYAGCPQGSVKQLYFIMQNSPVPTETRYKLLEAEDLSTMRILYLDMLKDELKNLVIRKELHQKTMQEIGMRQREEFLRTQMQQIRHELGDSDETDYDELIARAEYKEWGEDVRKRFDKELKKLRRFNPTTPDYAVQYAYLDTYLDLPWDHCDNSDFTLDKVQEVLDRDHFGLEKVKERIVEQMAVLKLRRDTKAPILCLYGPPGVGKTSLGKSVAEALGRKYVRVALGGLHDEAEIRGHRRTYLGSMPGRIINALEKCGTSDPVMVLDEIDKIGADYKGDPSQALLEVLDPEQNCKFHDNYIDQDYDLSKVLFIATANTLSTISSPLLDRMELIEIGGYIEAEKIEIAKRHLIRKSLADHGFEEDEICFTDDALMEIISSYTRESGVRRLEKKINDTLRKVAVLKASDKDYPKIVDKELVKEYLGKPQAFNDQYENNDTPGVVTGLAWTQAGGEILFIESSVAPGKEEKLTLTGNLGDVMKESAVLALQYVKANHEALGIPEEKLKFGTLHVHVPEGAVPKDGPSAGITIVTSIASTFTGRKVRSHLAMTGEITLRGKILPVGGIKEKILAAKRAGIKTVMLCEKNRKDIEEIKPEYLEGLDFHFVESVAEALDFALLP